VSQGLKEQMFVESDEFRTREFNAILGRAKSRGLLSLFSSPCWKCRLVMLSAGCSGFGGSRGRFRTVLAMCPEVPQKRHSFVVEQALLFLRRQFTSFPSFEERLGVDFFGPKRSPCSG